MIRLHIEKDVQKKREKHVKMKGRPLHSMESFCFSCQMEREERYSLLTLTLLSHYNACQKLYKAHCHYPILLASTVLLSVFRNARSLTVCFRHKKNWFCCWAKAGRSLEVVLDLFLFVLGFLLLFLFFGGLFVFCFVFHLSQTIKGPKWI